MIEIGNSSDEVHLSKLLSFAQPDVFWLD